MSNTHSTTKAENNANSANNANNEASKKTETTKMVPMSFDKMNEQSQIKVLERVAAEKNKELDGQFLYQELTKNGITRLPSKALQETALNARREFASGALGLLRSKQLIIETYNMATKEGFSPSEARKVVVILVTQNGKILSDRTVRRYLPEEAKDTSKVTEATKEKQAQPKTAEQQEGLTGIYLPPAACQAIAKFAAKNEPCMLYIKGKAYIKVKAAVVTETVKKENGQQVTQRASKK